MLRNILRYESVELAHAAASRMTQCIPRTATVQSFSLEVQDAGKALTFQSCSVPCDYKH